ncbi:IS3 family transposase, partial [Kordia jejudonensis]|uniref:IS3 family transposase n=1 Tax=Kordia jejudonensis TaxID=1348245 RepID=UPI000629CF27
LKRKKNYKRTTIAGKISYPNLIKGLEVNAPNIIWQSDITYIKVAGNHYYAVFIIDVYTKEIVGYSITDHMRAIANIKALQMALKVHPPPKFHHSDRGSQYTYKGYIKILKENNVQISMATSAQDNAYAERINRTIKEEYLNHWKPKNYAQLKRMIKKAVNNYNQKRLHNNIDRKPPTRFRTNFSLLASQQRKTITIFNNEILT